MFNIIQHLHTKKKGKDFYLKCYPLTNCQLYLLVFTTDHILYIIPYPDKYYNYDTNH